MNKAASICFLYYTIFFKKSFVSASICDFNIFDYYNFHDYHLFLNDTRAHVGVFLQSLQNLSSIFDWKVKSPGCLWVSLRAADYPFEIDVSLYSSNTFLFTKYEGCFNVTLKPDNKDLVWFCGFSFDIVDEGDYYIHIRSKVCQTPSENDIDWPEPQFISCFGRWTHAWTLRRRYQILATKPIDESLTNINRSHGIPLCTFHHEQHLYEGLGSPRWVKVSNSHQNHHAEILRRIWFEDSYEWVNGLCHYVPLTKDQFLHGMEQRDIRKVLFLGDSLSRFMMNDFKEFLGGVTQDWLKKNPVKYFDAENNTSNWDKVMLDWGLYHKPGEYFHFFNASYCNNLFDVEIEGRHIPSCCASNTCSNFSLEMKLHQLLPGLDGVVNRNQTQWETYIENLIGTDFEPDIVVFNAGLWLLGFPGPLVSRIRQMGYIAKAVAEICQKRHMTLVWRSTTYHHSNPVNHQSILMNKEAIGIISEYPNTYIFDSPFVMTALRPDTTSDGFHYSYRKPHGDWHLCDLPAESFRMNCLRYPDFPLSAGRGMTLMLANLFIHSGNILFNSSNAALKKNTQRISNLGNQQPQSKPDKQKQLSKPKGRCVLCWIIKLFRFL